MCLLLVFFPQFLPCPDCSWDNLAHDISTVIFSTYPFNLPTPQSDDLLSRDWQLCFIQFWGWGLATVGTERKEKMLSLYAIITCIPPVFPLNPHLQFSTFSADKAVLHYNRYTSYTLSTILTMPKTKQVWSLDHKTFIWKPPSVDECIKKMWSMDTREFYSVIKKMKS